MPELYSSPDVSEEKLSATTVELLTKLFSDTEYSNEEKLFYEHLFKNGIENFISGEIFTSHMIQLDIEEEKNNCKLFFDMALAFLLHERHNLKLNRGFPQNFNLETFDLYLYDVLCSFAHDNHPQWQQRDKALFNNGEDRGIDFFNKLRETSFRFMSPSLYIQYIWSGNKYQSSKNSPIDIFVYGYENKFDKYVENLLKRKFHSLGLPNPNNLKYSGFLKKVANISRSQRIEYALPTCRTADIDLILFCLSLGYGTEVFERIIKLREKGRTMNLNNPDYPNVGEDEWEYLKFCLRNSEENFNNVKSSQENIDLINISTIILDNVNKNLLAKNLNPIKP